MDNNTILDAIITRLRPEKAETIRNLITDAVAKQFGESPDPTEVKRFLDDIRVAQSMSDIDINYAEHYTDLHKAGVDFMRLVQAVKTADKDYR
ncbi:hypothetical protein DesfrDRAFT_1509 [Solidesulfovibrio fructosivorans JJ]]|uniref:Uncharacterized protein n=1 Tax=Solidesulfovibrio fructosivorans JJ] TaxID=596151 RepID=E1JV60_SOLFR|nr:hypothetical protein [Solidesulfovibrio fructosivorans]EFL51654.1 hypothetical protein DesfrDRAFT_1509 [Solidesulfovibrio fructosivorans JJ]]